MRLKRDIRYTVEPNDTTKVVRFDDFQGLERTCEVKDYSRTGVSFLLEDGSLLFKIGDIISDLRFYSLDKEIHGSPATIIHIQDEDDRGGDISRIGCTFNDRLMDIYSIIKADKITKLQNDFLDFIQSMAIEENLDPEFVHLTSHLHYILSGFQERLHQEEEKIRQEEEEVQPALLETLRELTFDALSEELNRYYDHFSRIIARFNDSKQHFIHREFFQKRLHEFFMQSALFNRSYVKPLGYAGDFEMMNIIYRNEFEGADLFSEVMGKIDCMGAAAQAVRNRRTYLYDKLGSLVRAHEKQDHVRIISVACGPTLEFCDILQSLDGRELPCQVEFIGMDQDKLALQDARRRIEPINNGRDDIEIRFVEDNIKRLIVGRDKERDVYVNADVVYTAGLFDYLSQRASNRLIHKLYTFLKPGGLLIIGNFGSHNPQRFIMEYGSEWFLLHRTEEELKALADGLPEDVILKVEKEPEGVNLFLNIQKPI